MLQRFDGHIVGLGTTSGTRIVVGMWEHSPLGAFADAMVEDAGGHRTLLAPTDEVADFVASTYTFDEIQVHPVHRAGWSFRAGPLTATWVPGGRAPVGRLLRAVPTVVSEAEAWARLCDPIARRVMPGVRTHGSAGQGRTEWYAARDAWHVDSLEASWEGRDLGPLAPLAPAVRFGFGSAPRRPTLTRLSSFVRLP
ncbi:hypothetical protein ACHAAC_12240 [Aeromicrobium sp. CF4.19]|uniref:hypothetical protein n=1 Tax=Aeromicrobium sp. CF4.19 TaxID=3373082 RepID=UPI003EE4C1D0